MYSNQTRIERETTMGKTLQSRVQGVKLMELNRREIIKALNDVGITEAKEDTPLSELAELIKWATGFGGCDLATVETATGKQTFFKADRWESMSSGERSSYISLGIRFRAEGKQWIVARSDATDGTNATTYVWSTQGADVPTLKNYGKEKSIGFLSDYDGERKTDIICSYAEASGMSYPAAQLCRQYKVATRDQTRWYLPDTSQWTLMSRYLSEINEALQRLFGIQLETDGYWTSDEYNTYSAILCLDRFPGCSFSSKGRYANLRACARVQEI